MTRRERLLTTLRRQPVDRVPISTYELLPLGPYGWPSQEPSYRRLVEYIDAQVDLLALWGAYMPDLPDTVPMSQEHWQEGEYAVTRTTLHTARGPVSCVTKETPSVKTVWTVEHFCKTEDDIDRVLSMPTHPLPPVDVSAFQTLDAELGERGIVLCDLGDAMGSVAPLFEFGEFTVIALTEPGRIRALLDREHERVMHKLRAMLEGGCGPLYRIWGPEYCAAPYLPPSAFKELVIPYLTEMVDLIHQYNCVARVHCHGRVADLLDMLVDIGVDALDPLEPPPDGDITLGEVKARYGKDLILFGNMELKFLETETPEQIDARVRAMMEEAKAGGGFVLMPTAGPINIPLSPRTEENYFAYIDAGLKYGVY